MDSSDQTKVTAGTTGSKLGRSVDGKMHNNFGLNDARHIVVQAIEMALRDFTRLDSLRDYLSALKLPVEMKFLAIGKSAVAMTLAAQDVLSRRQCSWDGYLLTKHGYAQEEIPGITILEAGHPVPDADSFRNSSIILSWLAKLHPENELLILLSGGGSSLFEIPSPGHSAEEIIKLYYQLLLGGQEIGVINAQRSELSAVKQGKALKYIRCEHIHVLALSDVYGNDPATIASAPFTPQGQVTKQVDYRIVGDNLSLLKSLLRFLPEPCLLHHEYIRSSVAEWGEHLADMALSGKFRGFHLWGGEAPVTVSPGGKGGRCTHLALDFAIRIAGRKNICLLTYASDGNDNVDGVAGAWVTGATAALISSHGIDPVTSLKKCDSLTALDAGGAVLPSTETRMNVNDIYLLGVF